MTAGSPDPSRRTASTRFPHPGRRGTLPAHPRASRQAVSPEPPTPRPPATLPSTQGRRPEPETPLSPEAGFLRGHAGSRGLPESRERGMGSEDGARASSTLMRTVALMLATCQKQLLNTGALNSTTSRRLGVETCLRFVGSIQSPSSSFAVSCTRWAIDTGCTAGICLEALTSFSPAGDASSSFVAASGIDIQIRPAGTRRYREPDQNGGRQSLKGMLHGIDVTRPRCWPPDGAF